MAWTVQRPAMWQSYSCVFSHRLGFSSKNLWVLVFSVFLCYFFPCTKATCSWLGVRSTDSSLVVKISQFPA